MDARARDSVGMQKAGGIAALYIAVAYLAAIPYFVVLVNYPSVVDPVQKVILLRDNYASMYWMHVVSFEFVALALIVVTLALHQRLKELAPSTTQFATVVGLIRAGLLLASVMVFNYGMGAVVRLYATAPAQAVSAWQVIEPVAAALGGSGGELLGGVWFLLLSAAALRAKVFPRAELARRGDRRRWHPFTGAGFERTGSRVRASPDRVVLLARDRHVADQRATRAA